jgi:hypothetical protein
MSTVIEASQKAEAKRWLEKWLKTIKRRMNNNGSSIQEFRGEICLASYKTIFKNSTRLSSSKEVVQLDTQLIGSLFDLCGIEQHSHISSREKGYFVSGSFFFMTKTNRYKICFSWTKKRLIDNETEL